MDKLEELKETLLKLALHCAETAETAEEMEALAAISETYRRFEIINFELRDAVCSAIIRFAESADCERDIFAICSVVDALSKMY